MITAGLLSVIFLSFWGFYSRRDNKETVKNATILGLFTTWLAYLFFIPLNDNWSMPYQKYYFLFFLLVFLLTIYIVSSTVRKKPFNIIARQQNYWNVPQSVIYDYFKSRVIDKKDRKEVEINTLSKKFMRKYDNETQSYFTTNIYNEYRQLDLTIVKNIKNIENYKLYTTIFLKIVEFIRYKEVHIDFEKILRENNMCIEYFLLDLWEKFTKEFNIGTATLNVLAKRNIEYELIGALDNVDLANVKRHGAALFYSYTKFKGRLPQEQKEIQQQVQNDEAYDL